MNKSLIAMAVFATLSAGTAAAAVQHNAASGHFPVAPFSAETSASGTARPLMVADRSYSRTTTATNRAGKTAERRTNVNVDSETKTRTRTVEGTTFQGKAYTGSSTTQRTEDGYVHTGTQVGPNGGTRTREVEAVVDRDSGTVTKDISVTGPNGETRSTTVVRHHEHSGDGAE